MLHVKGLLATVSFADGSVKQIPAEINTGHRLIIKGDCEQNITALTVRFANRKVIPAPIKILAHDSKCAHCAIIWDKNNPAYCIQMAGGKIDG